MSSVTRGAQLGSMEMERLREERKQFQEEIRIERETLDSLKHERRSIEGEITKQKMTREQHTRKLRLVFEFPFLTFDLFEGWPFIS